jgi:NAD(P)-dependent dehydrogenase (short-subunit alcohol dehydrogenase family)
MFNDGCAQDKVILITGCSSGIGLAAADYFLKSGFRVAPSVRAQQDEERLNSRFQSYGDAVCVVRVDVTQSATIEAAIAVILGRWGRIDIVINNAGVAYGGAFECLCETDIRRQIEVNLFGVQNVCRAVLPQMRHQQSGLIINISSVAGFIAFPFLGAYATSKWALEAFTESLRYEVVSFGLHVALVEPASYRSEIFNHPDRMAQTHGVHQIPYAQPTTALRQRIDNHKAGYKEPDAVIRCLDRVIRHRHPPLRNFPDHRSWCLYLLKKLCPSVLYDKLIRIRMRSLWEESR